jgi:hypothetical protein
VHWGNERPRCKGQNNIKTDLEGTGFEDVTINYDIKKLSLT